MLDFSFYASLLQRVRVLYDIICECMIQYVEVTDRLIGACMF